MNGSGKMSVVEGNKEAVPHSSCDFDYIEDYQEALRAGFSNEEAQEYAENERFAREQVTDQDNNHTNTEFDEAQQTATYQRSDSVALDQVNNPSLTHDTSSSDYPLISSIEFDDPPQQTNDDEDSQSFTTIRSNPYGYEPPPQFYETTSATRIQNHQANISGAPRYQNEDTSAYTDDTDWSWVPFNVSLPHSSQTANQAQTQIRTRVSTEALYAPDTFSSTERNSSYVTNPQYTQHTTRRTSLDSLYAPHTSLSAQQSSFDATNPLQPQNSIRGSYGQTYTYTTSFSPQRSSLQPTNPQQAQVQARDSHEALYAPATSFSTQRSPLPAANPHATTRIPRQPVYAPSAPSRARDDARMTILDNLQQVRESRRRQQALANPPPPPPPPPPPSQPQPQPAQPTTTAPTLAQTFTTTLPTTYAGRRNAAARSTFPFECSACNKRYLYLNSAQKHWRMSHEGEGAPRIVERWPDAPARPPPATPRNKAAADARVKEKGGAGAGGTTMAGQMALPAFNANAAASTTTLPLPPPRPTPSHIALLRARVATGEIPVPLPPSGVIDEDDSSLTWVGQFGRWYRRAREVGESVVWEYWDGVVGVWRRG